ncbi:MAG: hypothetical protein INQ03_14420 [Candidatus Heimdallarchaeota archaeon]|nr:hypothetical protein [Candidatus Heimdallarchaeota archaeon]
MSRIKFDIFSLSFLGEDPSCSRSTGMVSVCYNAPLKLDIMKNIIVELFSKYHHLAGSIEIEDNTYYYNIPEYVTPDEVLACIQVSDISYQELFNKLSMKPVNHFDGPLYQLYLLDHSDNFDIVIFASHLIGDGLTAASWLSLITYNYYLELAGMVNEKIFPEMHYFQLVEYASKMRHTRFRPLLVPSFLRFIPGAIAYLKKRRIKVDDQIFNDPVPYNIPISLKHYTFPAEFTSVLNKLKQSLRVNSNHLIVALLNYALMNTQNYKRVVCVYPINLRNRPGLEAGNLVTLNTIESTYQEDFLDYLVATRRLLEKEKSKSGPYYVISTGKLIKPDFEKMKARSKKIMTASNIRFSNVGRLPAANLEEINLEVFSKIPLSDFHVNALPLSTCGAHFFISSIVSEKVNDYYLTILYSKKTEKALFQVLEKMETIIQEMK